MNKSPRPNIIYRKYCVLRRVPPCFLSSAPGRTYSHHPSPLFLSLTSSLCSGSYNFSSLPLSLSHDPLSLSLSRLYRYTDASRFIPGNCLLNFRGMRQQPRSASCHPFPLLLLLLLTHSAISRAKVGAGARRETTDRIVFPLP